MRQEAAVPVVAVEQPASPVTMATEPRWSRMK
jgi:hypothetical protein